MAPCETIQKVAVMNAILTGTIKYVLKVEQSRAGTSRMQRIQSTTERYDFFVRLVAQMLPYILKFERSQCSDRSGKESLIVSSAAFNLAAVGVNLQSSFPESLAQGFRDAP